MKDFRKLKVWEKGHQLTLKVYKISNGFPRDEVYGLTSQLRRSCTSIPNNIAEGCGRYRDTEFRRFLEIAMGSASETEYLVMLARDLSYMNESEFDDLSKELVEIKKMLTTLMRKLKLTADS